MQQNIAGLTSYLATKGRRRKFFVVAAGVFAAFGASLLIRWCFLPVVSSDMRIYLLPWVQTFAQKGLDALREGVGNYNIPYLLYLAFIAKLPVNHMVAIKVFSIVFDYLLAGALGWLVYILRAGRPRPKRLFWAAGAFAVACLLPLPIINSAFWGQCDSVYAFFCVLTLIFVVKNRWVAAFVFFAVALSFKLQAIFILPFIIYAYFSQRRYRVVLLAPVVPVVMFFFTLPAVVRARSAFIVVEIYTSQAKEGKLFLNYPSIWALQQTYDKIFLIPAIVGALMVCCAMMLWIIYKQIHAGREGLLLLAIWSVLVCVLFLPGMHDRYAYVAEVLLVVWFLARPGWRSFIPAAAVNFVGFCAYSSFIFKGWPFAAEALAVINLAVFVYFTRQLMLQLLKDTQKSLSLKTKKMVV